MEYLEGQKLKEYWGKRPCDHPRLERLYYAGAFLITYTCVQCGADFTISQKLEMDEIRKHQSKAGVK